MGNSSARLLNRRSTRVSSARFSVLLTSFVLAIALGLPNAAVARDSAARKVGRGVANLTLGVLAIPGEIMQTTQERGVFVGATWGLTKGLGMLVAHEVVGAWEIVTCPFETPPGFKPILEPEYPWGYFYEPNRSTRLTHKRREARER